VAAAWHDDRMSRSPDESPPSLLDRWLGLARRAAPGAAEVVLRETGTDLLARYRETHRHYHDLRHLTEVLEWLGWLAADGVPESAEDAASAENAGGDDTLVAATLAAWWHDAVYDPRRTDNEERSAALARTALSDLAVEPALAAEVGRLVELTARHRTDPGDVAGTLLRDADLAILGAATDRYAEYAAGIRAEFGHLPDDVFRSRRADVLRAFGTLPTIYATEAARCRLESAARRNLAAELAHLTSGAGAPAATAVRRPGAS
jgi:predicted metal-dependent HD superfamily phosphohydrolase